MLAFQHGTAFSLVVDIFSEASQEVVIRGFTKEGEFRFSILTAAGSNLTETVLRIPDIPIMLTVTASEDDFDAGSVYARVELGINGTRIVTLLEGYPDLRESLAWPIVPFPTLLAQRGQIVPITGTNPAAGVEISETVPNNNYWRLKALRAAITTDSNTANRRPVLRITINSIIVCDCINPTTTTANSTVTYQWGHGLQYGTDSIGLFGSGGLISDLLLPPGSVIATVTAGILAGDNWAAPTLLVERFLRA